MTMIIQRWWSLLLCWTSVVHTRIWDHPLWFILFYSCSLAQASLTGHMPSIINTIHFTFAMSVCESEVYYDCFSFIVAIQDSANASESLAPILDLFLHTIIQDMYFGPRWSLLGEQIFLPSLTCRPLSGWSQPRHDTAPRSLISVMVYWWLLLVAFVSYIY